jgi:hypothetical protein
MEVKLWTYIQEVLGSNPDWGTTYRESGFRGFPQSFQADARIVPQSMTASFQMLSSSSLFIFHPTI